MRALVFAILLAACNATETDQRWAADDARRCAGYGFTPGTADWSGCLMRLDVARRRMLVDAFGR